MGRERYKIKSIPDPLLMGDELIIKKIAVDYGSSFNGCKQFTPYNLLWLYDEEARNVMDDTSLIQVGIKRKKGKIQIQIILQCN